jgi:hypothetical protein
VLQGLRNELDLTAVKVIGLCGDRGKLTASRFCDAVLRAAHINPHPLSSLRLGSVAPSLSDLQLAGQDAILLPLPSSGDHPLNVAIFTGLRPQCDDSREPFQELSPAIEDLFRGLSHSGDRVPFAVVNRDDSFGEGLLGMLKVPYISYGTDPKAHVRATQISLGDQAKYCLETPLGHYWITLKSSGFFNVLHSLAAVAMGIALRLDLEVIISAVESVESYSGQYEVQVSQAHPTLAMAA